MPSKSKAQHNLMAMVANNPKAAKRMGIPQSVGQDFMEADKGRKFGSGSSTRATINKQDTKHGKMDLPVSLKGKGYKQGDLVKESKMDRKALEMSAARRRAADAAGRAMMGSMKGAAPAAPMSAAPATPAGPAMMKKGGMAGGYRRAADGIASKGKTKGSMVKMASGGAVGGYRRAADGIASKGKTKGKMVKMNYGGKC